MTIYWVSWVKHWNNNFKLLNQGFRWENWGSVTIDYLSGQKGPSPLAAWLQSLCYDWLSWAAGLFPANCCPADLHSGSPIYPHQRIQVAHPHGTSLWLKFKHLHCCPALATWPHLPFPSSPQSLFSRVPSWSQPLPGGYHTSPHVVLSSCSPYTTSTLI